MALFSWGKQKQSEQALEKKLDETNKSLLELKARLINPTPQYQFNPLAGNFVMAPIFQDVNKYINTGFNMNSTVYAIIQTCSEKFGSIPWGQYEVKNKKKAEEYFLRKKFYSGEPVNLHRLMQLKEQAFDEVDNTDLLRLWNNPHDQISGADFRAFAIMFKMLTGSATINANMGATGMKPQELNILPTQFIQLWPDATLNNFSRITYNITGVQFELKLEDTLYWKYNNPNFTITGEHLYGQAPLRAAGVEVDADNQNVLAQKFMFENAGVAGLWTPKDLPTAAALTNTLADTLRQTLDDLHNRDANTTMRPYANQPMEYTSYGMDAKEMELVATRRLNKEFIANVFNFPIQLLSGENSSYNNLDTAVKYVVTNTIYANLCSYRDNMNRWLVPKFGYKPGQCYLDFDLSGLPELQADYQKMVDSLAKMDWITYDEKREAMKYDAKGGAYATAYIPSSSVPIELAGDMGAVPNNGVY